MGILRSGGGRLNNVDATIKAVTMTTKPFGDKTSDQYGEQLYAVLTVLKDGETETIDEPLKIGNTDKGLSADDYVISGGVSDKSQLGKFIVELLKAGVSETSLSEDDGETIDLEPLVNARVRFTMRADTDTQDKFGKRKWKDKKTGKLMEGDRRYLGVTTVYNLGNGAAAPTVTRAKGGKPNGKAETVSVEQVAAETVAAIIKESPSKSVLCSKLPAKVALKLGKDYPSAKQVQEFVGDTAWLAAQDGFNYNDETDKVSL